MKRLIAAVSFALVAAPAFAVELGKPYEQLDVDRALPNISTEESAGSPWANDHNFIAPAP